MAREVRLLHTTGRWTERTGEWGLNGHVEHQEGDRGMQPLLTPTTGERGPLCHQKEGGKWSGALLQGTGQDVTI